MSELSYKEREEIAERLFRRDRDLDATQIAESFARLSVEPPWFDAPRGRWLIGRASDARLILTDASLTNDLTRAAADTQSARLAERLGASAVSMLFADKSTHSRIRATLGQAFSPQAVSRLSPWIHESAAAALGEVRRSDSVDLASDLVQPFVVSVIYKALGFASPASERLHGLVDDLFSYNRLFDLTAPAATVGESQDAGARIDASIAAELERFAAFDSSPLLEDERKVLLASLAFTLRAGVVTTSCLLVQMLLDLFGATDVAAIDRVPLAATMASSTPVFEAGRVNGHPVTISGVSIPGAQTLICLLPAANHDAAHGEESRAFLTFGGGEYRCLGASIVHAQAEALLSAMENHACRFDIAPTRIYHETPSFRGLRSVVVTWR